MSSPPWIEDDVPKLGRVVAGLAGVGIVVLFAIGWRPPLWLVGGAAGILFYCAIIIAIAQLGELIWKWVRRKN